MDLKAFLSDPHRRNLSVLAAAALVCIALAWLGLHEQASQVAPEYQATEFFPGLAREVSEGKAVRVHIVSKKFGAFDVALEPDKGGWVLPARSDYPASYEQVNRTLVGLAGLETIEPKTARVDWLHYVGLDDPARGGDGVLISVSDEKGHVLAQLIMGKNEDIGDPSGAVGYYARRPNETQSWLVRSVFEPRGDPGDWTEKHVADIDRTRIQEVDVDPAAGPSYEVSREKPSDADFKLTPLPKGRVLASEAAPDAVASSIVDFGFDDVKPAKDIDFANSSRLVTKTFDGLTVTVNIVHLGQEYWAQLSADAVAGKPDAAKEARTIDARASGWAYKLPDYKGAQFMTTLESLLQPRAAKAAK
jgi:hypothetical protein